MKSALVLPGELGPAGRRLRQSFRQRSGCTNPVLLIMSAANGHWFAAGIPKNDTDDQ